MKGITFRPATVVMLSSLSFCVALLVANPREKKMNVSTPRYVDPGAVGGAPADAIVLFDGTDLSKWRNRKGGGPAEWIVQDGVATVNGTGDIATRESFGDAQFHIEWAIPADTASDRKHGNSGIKFHERYEIQIINSYMRTMRPETSCGSVYVQHPPLVNVSRQPGEWQSYDIIFRAPRFDEIGNLVSRGTFTVFHNGVLIHDNVTIFGPTNSTDPVKPLYMKPLFVQDHGSPVRFRNIWIRPLADRE